MKIIQLLVLPSVLSLFTLLPLKQTNVYNSEKGFYKLQEEQIKSNKILFVNFSIKKNASGESEIRELKQTIVKGKLKKGWKINKSEAKEGDLVFQLLDANKNIIATSIIEDPLTKVYEYPTDDYGIGKSTLNLTEANFSVRIQLNHSAVYGSIKRVNSVGKSSSKKLIFKIK